MRCRYLTVVAARSSSGPVREAQLETSAQPVSWPQYLAEPGCWHRTRQNWQSDR
ncbi:DUF6766 family protein [Actinoplanes derwentensis]|uniref:DUF6766 family protein n=1 Tax=Actinoplanes derwentensis TaxID=113562 RepID=UPI0035A22E48